MASSALVPVGQAALAPEPEILSLGTESENRQYQQILSVAASQETRLIIHKGIRRRPGYDLKDPWLVVGDEDDSGGNKRSRYEKLVPGVPCLVMGSRTPVAYLGPVDGVEGECHVRELGGRTARQLRKHLMPMPTRPALQGDWALPVGLTGEQTNLNGRRGICGLVGQFQSGGRGIWVSFEPAESTHPPEFVLLAEDNLVALPTPPAGAPRTPWETRSLALRSSSSLPMLADESAMENQLALRDDNDDGEDDDDASVELSDSSDDEDLVLAVGALVALHRDLAKPTGGQRYWRVEKLQGEGDSAVVVIRLLNGKQSGELTCKAKDLSLVSEKEIGLASTCQHCKAAEPEHELLMCEHFSTSCLGCAHIGCLTPPLKKVPRGSWFCRHCADGGGMQLALVESEKPAAADKVVPTKAQVKVEKDSSGKKPKAQSKSAAKAKPAAKRKN